MTCNNCGPDNIQSNYSKLMQQIIHLIEGKKLYLNSTIKTSDIAEKLGLHRNQVSACVNAQLNMGFSKFINRYRVDYAKEIMRKQPDMKIHIVGIESGFSNETSFYRTFKALTDMTPSEWKSKNR